MRTKLCCPLWNCATYKNMPNIDQINNLNRELFMQDYLQCWGYVFLAALAFSTTSLGM